MKKDRSSVWSEFSFRHAVEMLVNSAPEIDRQTDIENLALKRCQSVATRLRWNKLFAATPKGL